MYMMCAHICVYFCRYAMYAMCLIVMSVVRCLVVPERLLLTRAMWWIWRAGSVAAIGPQQLTLGKFGNQTWQ